MASGPTAAGAASASIIVTALVLMAGCSTGGYVRRTDREVASLLASRTRETLGERERNAARPIELEPGVPSQAAIITEELTLDLAQTLTLAVQGNRDHASQRETLYLTILNLLGTRHDFSPQLSSLLSYTFGDVSDGAHFQDGSWTLGASQITPWGGTLSVDGSLSGSDAQFVDPSYSSSVGVTLSQPLLRGAGFEVSHEALVQAERTAIYEIRSFELFREDFSIDVASRFYGLVRAQKEIQNQQENLERSSFDLNKAEALFRVGRVTQIESLRAKRQNLNSENALIAAEEGYEQQLEDFRIFLGLPETTRVKIDDTPPEYIRVNYDTQSAIAVALENRLDLLTRRAQLEDVRRAVRIAGNALLPELDVSVSAGLSSGFESSIGALDLNQSDVSAGFTLALPLDRHDEHNSYRSAQIRLARAERSLDEFEEGLKAGIRNALRELARRENSVRITRELIEGEVKNKRIAELQFERGKIDNRELVDAEQSLLDARNNLINEQVTYEISRLQLLRDLGILFIDENGMWKK